MRLSVPGVYGYTLGLSFLCWVVGYIFSVGYPVSSGINPTPLWQSLCQILPGKEITYLTGLLLMTGGALLIQRTNYMLMLIREKTFLPFVVYILLVSTNPDFFPLKSTSVGIFCLILSLYGLFRSYHNPLSQGSIYKIALLIGTGSLLWIHLLWFMPLIWYGMYSFKSLNFRTFLASLLGLLTIYWFLFAWCLWIQDFSFITVPFTTLANFRLLLITGEEVYEWLGLLLVAMLTVIASVQILTHEYEEGLRTRQYLWFLIVFTIVSFLLFFVYEQISEEFLLIACLPSSILLSHFFAVRRKRIVFWTYHVFVIVLSILFLMRLWNILFSTAI